MRRRFRRYRGRRRCAPNFISPCSPYRAFRANVCHTRTEADTAPKPIQNHWSMPTMYRMTNRTNKASSPPQKMKRYCAFNPLNSTERPIPLLIGNSAIVAGLEEERTQNRRRHDKKDTRTEPRSGGLRRVGITRREFAVHLDAADQAYHRADGVDQLRRGIQIAPYHTRGFVDARKAVALRKGRGGSQQKGCRKKKMLLRHRLFFDCAGRVDSPPGGLILIFTCGFSGLFCRGGSYPYSFSFIVCPFLIVTQNPECRICPQRPVHPFCFGVGLLPSPRPLPLRSTGLNSSPLTPIFSLRQRPSY